VSDDDLRVARLAAELRVEWLRLFLATAAPKAAEPDLDRFANSIAWQAKLRAAAHLAESRRNPQLGQQDLVKLRKKVIALAGAIDTLRADAFLALRGEETPGDMLRVLGGWNERIVAAHNTLAAQPPVPTRMGVTPKIEQGVAACVGRIYRVLTGRDPTVSTRPAIGTDPERSEPYGPFFDLLDHVFAVLDLDGNAEHFGKEFGKAELKPQKK
jgi:hypothetical protein